MAYALDYVGKRVVVIGSGATAITLVPEMARTAAHVTMLQRSPTYVVSRPAQDALANKLRRNLPANLAYHLIRWRNVLLGMYFFQLSRKKPARVKELILKGVRMALGPDYDVALHPMGSAAVPRARRRPVQGDPGKPRLRRHQGNRPLRQKRHPPQGRQRTASRHHRHSDRACAADFGRHASERRRPGDRFREKAALQGHDVFRRAQSCLRLRLYQRVLDAEMRSHLRICLPADQLHGSAQLPEIHAPQ